MIPEWTKVISPDVEKCGYCGKRIKKFSLYFRRIITLDDNDPLGKNVCSKCVEAAKEKKLG